MSSDSALVEQPTPKPMEGQANPDLFQFAYPMESQTGATAEGGSRAAFQSFAPESQSQSQPLPDGFPQDVQITGLDEAAAGDASQQVGSTTEIAQEPVQQPEMSQELDPQTAMHKQELEGALTQLMDIVGNAQSQPSPEQVESKLTDVLNASFDIGQSSTAAAAASAQVPNSANAGSATEASPSTMPALDSSAPMMPAEAAMPQESVAPPAEAAMPQESVAAPAEAAAMPQESVAPPAEATMPQESVAAPAEAAMPQESVAAPAEAAMPQESVAAPAEAAMPQESLPTQDFTPPQTADSPEQQVQGGPVDALDANLAGNARTVELQTQLKEAIKDLVEFTRSGNIGSSPENQQLFAEKLGTAAKIAQTIGIIAKAQELGLPVPENF